MFVASGHKCEVQLCPLFRRIAKLEAMDITEVAKIAIDAPDALLIDETEFVGLVTKAAQKVHPNLRSDAAFAKVYSEQSERGTLLRKACSVLKGMATLAPSVTGGPDAERDAINNTEASEAYKQLMELAEAQRAKRDITQAAAFAAVVADPANRELAAKALARPMPPANGHYGYPR